MTSKCYIQFSLLVAGLTSETSAGKLRLGMDLISSGTSTGLTAQPAVLLLPLEVKMYDLKRAQQNVLTQMIPFPPLSPGAAARVSYEEPHTYRH